VDGSRKFEGKKWIRWDEVTAEEYEKKNKGKQ
jgi:hypothetical protein